VQIEPHGELGYRQKPNAHFTYGNGVVATANAMGFRGPTVEVPKPARTFRIVLLGESTTHGWSVGDGATIDGYMRRLLANRTPGVRFEVVNLAFDGYDAYQIYERLKSDGLRLQPDVLIANTGINDVRNAKFANLTDKDPRTLIWEAELVRLRDEAAHGTRLSSRIKHWFYLARLPSLLRDFGARRAMPRTGPRAPQAHAEAADNFALNLRRIAALAAADSVPLIFSVPPSIITNPDADTQRLSPRDYWLSSKEETQAYRDTLSARMHALADSLAAHGQRVSFQTHRIPVSDFLDDCHLKSTGNQLIARDFVAALAPYLPGAPTKPARR
jgi:lysophospholipase L1-like esterase